MIGIYKITSPTNRVYIGQSVTIEKRFNSYKKLHKKNEGVVKLYRSFVKHGVNNHIFEIIEECEISELNTRERYWQEYYDVLNIKVGLNCRYTKTNDKSGKASKETLGRMSEASKGNNHWLGKSHRQETKDKIGNANRGRKYSKEVNLKKGRKGKIPPLKGLFGINNPLSIRINQYTKEGVFIKTWCGMNDINRELGYHIGNVCSCCKGNLKTYKGYIWKYKN